MERYRIKHDHTLRKVYIKDGDVVTLALEAYFAPNHFVWVYDEDDKLHVIPKSWLGERVNDYDLEVGDKFTVEGNEVEGATRIVVWVNENKTDFEYLYIDGLGDPERFVFSKTFLNNPKVTVVG